MHNHHAHETLSRICEMEPIIELRRATTSRLRDTIVVSNTATRMDTAPVGDNDVVFDGIILKNPEINWFNNHLSCTTSTSALKKCNY